VQKGGDVEKEVVVEAEEVEVVVEAEEVVVSEA
jgi:hypothetical protein